MKIPLNKKTGKCNGLALVLVPEHVRKEILELNGKTLENRIIVIEDWTATKKRDAKKFTKNFCLNMNPNKPSCIGLLLTNSFCGFFNTETYFTGLSDCHKLVLSANIF